MSQYQKKQNLIKLIRNILILGLVKILPQKKTHCILKRTYNLVRLVLPEILKQSFVFKLKRQAIRFSNIKKFDELVFSFTPKNTYSVVKDVYIKFNGEKIQFIKGKITNDSWTM